MEIGETFCGRTDVRTYGRTEDTPEFQSTRSSVGDELQKIGLRPAVVQVPYCRQQPSVVSSTPKWRRR